MMIIETRTVEGLLEEAQRQRSATRYAPDKVRERLDINIAILKEVLEGRERAPQGD